MPTGYPKGPRPLNHHVQRMTEQAREDICGLYEQGSTIKELAISYGVDYTTIRWHLLRRGVILRPRNSFAQRIINEEALLLVRQGDPRINPRLHRQGEVQG